MKPTFEQNLEWIQNVYRPNGVRNHIVTMQVKQTLYLACGNQYATHAFKVVDDFPQGRYCVENKTMIEQWDDSIEPKMHVFCNDSGKYVPVGSFADNVDGTSPIHPVINKNGIASMSAHEVERNGVKKYFAPSGLELALTGRTDSNPMLFLTPRKSSINGSNAVTCLSIHVGNGRLAYLAPMTYKQCLRVMEGGNNEL